RPPKPKGLPSATGLEAAARGSSSKQGTRTRAAGRGCWLFQSQVVCQLGLAETDQLGFDADDHAGALVDGLADVLDQSHDVARCGAALVQQNERLGRIDLGSAGAAAFQAARFDQKRRGYLDRVLRQKPVPQLLQSRYVAGTKAFAEVRFQPLVLRLIQNQVLEE